MKHRSKILWGAACLGAACVGLFAWRAPAHPDARQVAVPTAPAATVAATVEPVEATELALLPATVETPAELRALVRACRAADEGDREQLVGLAGSPDPLVAGNALSALGRLGLVDVPFLDPFLVDERLRVRQAAILALAGAEEASAAQRLADLVHPEADPTARALAIRGLGRVGGGRAHEVLAALGEGEGLSAVDRAFLQAARRDAVD